MMDRLSLEELFEGAARLNTALLLVKSGDRDHAEHARDFAHRWFERHGAELFAAALRDAEATKEPAAVDAPRVFVPFERTADGDRDDGEPAQENWRPWRACADLTVPGEMPTSAHGPRYDMTIGCWVECRIVEYAPVSPADRERPGAEVPDDRDAVLRFIAGLRADLENAGSELDSMMLMGELVRALEGRAARLFPPTGDNR